MDTSTEPYLGDFVEPARKRPSAVRRFFSTVYGRFCILCFAIGYFFGGSGCALLPEKPMPVIRTKSSTELGIEALSSEWLRPCFGITATRGNDVGNLLDDFNDAAGALSICMERHNRLVEYLQPIVNQERSAK